MAKGHNWAFSTVILLITVIVFGVYPNTASAGILSSFANIADAETISTSSSLNSQKVALAQSTIGPGSFDGAVKSQVDVISSATTLSPQMGPLGSVADVAELPQTGEISIYVVHAGDTTSSVAKMFGVTRATILAANDLTSSSKLKEGQTLVILPVAGYLHTVSKGDTFSSISKRYKVAMDDILFYNDLPDDAILSIGQTLVIPDAEFTALPTVAPKTSIKSSSSTTSIPKVDPSKPDFGNFILRPVDISQSTRTQGAHGWNNSSVDIGAKTGTPVVAAHDGLVMLAKTGGWNGGYGNYIIIMTEYNGRKIQTIYGHLSKVLVNPGDTVTRGQLIGLVGSTGNSTGPHLHFEVRGILNPLTINRNYTGK